VRELLTSAGVQVIQTPFRAPNANAHAERFVRSVRTECLSRVIPLGERHFRETLQTFVEHYHHERNHQGLGNRVLEYRATQSPGPRIRRRERLGGLLSYYYRAA
jgi:putative transposase